MLSKNIFAIALTPTLLLASELPSLGSDKWRLSKHQDFGYAASISSLGNKETSIGLRCISDSPTLTFKSLKPLGSPSDFLTITLSSGEKKKDFKGKLFVDKDDSGVIPTYLNYNTFSDLSGLLSMEGEELEVTIKGDTYTFVNTGYPDAHLIMEDLCLKPQ